MVRNIKEMFYFSQSNVAKEVSRRRVVAADREASLQRQSQAAAQVSTGIREVYQR